MRQLLTVLGALVISLASVPASAQQQTDAQVLASVLASPARSEDRKQDAIRHPAETLSFFRIKSGMKVAEVLPGRGWYARVLIPYLGKSGQYIGVNPDVRRANDPLVAESWSDFSKKFPTRLAAWGLAGTNATGANSNDLGSNFSGKVDRVLMVREMHNLFRFDVLHSTLTTARRILKSDGLLGIVQHRTKPWAPASYVDGSKGYMRERDVIALVEAHGFELVGTSEINANVRDAADNPGGIWALPSTANAVPGALNDIGNSDRMTLLFRKRP